MNTNPGMNRFVLDRSVYQRRITARMIPSESSQGCFQIRPSTFSRLSALKIATATDLPRRLHFYDENMLAVEHRFAALIDHFACFDDPAKTWPFRVFFLSLDCDARVNRVAYKDRFRETQPVVSVSECNRIDLARRQSDSNRERHGSVSDALTEQGLTRELRVHMMGKEVARVPGMQNEISLGKGPSRGLSLGPDDVVLEVFDFFHYLCSPTSFKAPSRRQHSRACDLPPEAPISHSPDRCDRQCAQEMA